MGGAAALVLIAGSLAVLASRRPAPPADTSTPVPAIREPGLPAGFRSSPVVALPPRLTVYSGARFLGFSSAPGSTGVVGTWLFVVPGGRCDQILATYAGWLRALGHTVTRTGSLARWSSDAGGGAVECPFPTPTDATGAALDGPWLAITSNTQST
ncbi:MAG: hypothetical protein ACYDAC_05295 [Candidatus Dormibacteria bacterium]